MLTTRHTVDFAYTRPELEALFASARAHDVEQGGRDDARSACIILWSHHWLNDLRADLDARFAGQTAAVHGRFDEVSARFADLQGQLQDVETCVQTLEDRMTVLEATVEPGVA